MRGASLFRRVVTPALVLSMVLASVPAVVAGTGTTLLSASFDSGTDGFTYVDDAFLATSQPAYASGDYRAPGGYAGGGLHVALGGVDSSTVATMSGGWRATLDLPAPASGVAVTFRYRLQSTAGCTYDEFGRVLVSLDGALLGRGSRDYVDHVGGDATVAHDTGWLQHQVYLGDLAAGAHTIVLGGCDNRKITATQTVDAFFDDVTVTTGNVAPATTTARTLVDRLDIASFKSFDASLAAFGDRWRLDTTKAPYTSYWTAQSWVEQQLRAMGYAPQRQEYTSANGLGTASNLYATKTGAVHPERMYIVAAHLDGRGGGSAADDDGSGCALTLEIARVLASPDVQTDCSVRFIFWDEEESGLRGSQAYVAARRALQGQESPAGSGQYLEPTWLGIIQHDCILYDHGVTTRLPSQSPYADLDVEWAAPGAKAAQSTVLAQAWRAASGTYSSAYPANAANGSQGSDDTSFRDWCPAIQVRENRRGLPAEWLSPYYHTSGDVYANYSDDDFRLGFNAVQGTLGTVAELAGAAIVAVNHLPAVVPQWVTTWQGAPVGITLTGTDADGDSLTYRVLGPPAHGTLTGTAPALVYTPAAGFRGGDSFAFVANDGKADSPQATVWMTVAAANNPPHASGASMTTPEDTLLAVGAPGVLAGATDADGDGLSAALVSGPAHGTLALDPDGSFTYSPAPDWNGTDAFAYRAWDGRDYSQPATATVIVSAVNDAPSATTESYVATTGVRLSVPAPGVLGNDLDVDGDRLTASLLSAPSTGTLVLGSDGSFLYDPPVAATGTVSFLYRAFDGHAYSGLTAVSIDVRASRVTATRFGGADRYAVAADLARSAYPGFGGVKHVIVVSGVDRAAADPICAAGLAGLYHAPILTLDGTRPGLPDTTARALIDVAAANPGRIDVHIIGGPASVPEAFKARIARLVPKAVFERIGGADRYEVAANIALRMKALLRRAPDAVIVANAQTSDRFFVPLALAPISANRGIPVLLTRAQAAPASTAAAMRSLGVPSSARYAAGNQGAIGGAVLKALGVPAANRIASATDPTRFGDACAIAEYALARGWLDADSVGLANKLSDALTGGAYMGAIGGPLLYTDAASLAPATRAFLTAHRATVRSLHLVGGPASVAPATEAEARQALE